MKNSEISELIQSSTVEYDWTKDEYNALVEDLELRAVINYSWEQELKNDRLKEVAINKVNTVGYPEFRAFLLQEIMKSRYLATDIMFEYSASQKWMINRKKQFQPISYMERVLKRNGDLLSEFRSNNIGCSIPTDFRVIRPETTNSSASEVGNTIVREYIIGENKRSKPKNKVAEFLADSVKWMFLSSGLTLIICCLTMM